MRPNFTWPKTFSRKRKIGALKMEILRRTAVIFRTATIKSQNTAILLSNAWTLSNDHRPYHAMADLKWKSSQISGPSWSNHTNESTSTANWISSLGQKDVNFACAPAGKKGRSVLNLSSWLMCLAVWQVQITNSPIRRWLHSSALNPLRTDPFPFILSSVEAVPFSIFPFALSGKPQAPWPHTNYTTCASGKNRFLADFLYRIRSGGRSMCAHLICHGPVVLLHTICVWKII